MPLLMNLRVALRSLLKHRAFSGMAVLILALGIGANTAIFSVVNAVLIRSLPYGDPASLVTVFGDGVARGQGGRLPVTAGDFAWWQERTKSFAGLAALHNESRRITSVETPVVPLVHAVTANYFDVLGSKPALGRGFLPGEDTPGRANVVVLGYGIWQTIYGADPSVVGRTIDLDGEPHTVVGVMGREFFSTHVFAVQPGLFVPKAYSLLRDEHATRDVLVYGRLAPGQTLGAAQAEMSSIAADLSREHPDTNDRWGAAVVPIRELAVGQFGPTGMILLAAVSLVLLIACANVANLTLSRASERSREVALRVALGGSRGRIVTELMTESVLLSFAGGALGALLAFLVKDPLAGMIPAQAGVPFLDRVSIDGPVLLFTMLISLASGLLFGLFPAREATRVNLVEVLREGGRSQGSPRGRRFRGGLVVAEVGLAVVVAAFAGLMLRTFDGLQGLAPGFDADRVLTLRTSLRGEDFATPASRQRHFDELKRRLESIPGISTASATSFEPPMPAAGVFGGTRISLPGVSDDAATATSAIPSVVMPDFFSTLGIPVIKGRVVNADDGPMTRRVAVINQAMAEKYFGGVDPIGRSFSLFGPRAPMMEIVGVVANVISTGTDPTPGPVFYTPYAQNPLPVMTVVMRVPQGDPMAVAREAEAAAWSLSRSTNVYFIQTLAKKIEDLNWRPRLGASLLGAFAGLALILGAVGIYAVISYTVLQRRTEIGLRMALGARASAVSAMILRGGLGLAVKGVLGGLLASLFATRALKGFLYGVAPNDPLTLALVSLVLFTVAALACLIPALRASRLNPGVVLKE
jgi:putative ABC transport system permease protein